MLAWKGCTAILIVIRMMRAIINQWRNLGTVVNPLRLGQPTKITPRAHQ